MAERSRRSHRVLARLGSGAMGVYLFMQLGMVWDELMHRAHRPSHHIPDWLFYRTIGSLMALSLVEQWISSRDDMRGDLAEAIARIGADGGEREARTSLPDLEAIAESRWGQKKSGRAKLLQAVKVIRSLPERAPHPIPASAPPTAVSEPFVPAAGSTSKEANFPRPTRG